VTAAVLIATARTAEGAVAAAQPWQGETVLARLIRQLEDRGLGEVTVIARPGSEDALRPSLGAARLVVCADAASDLRALARLDGDLLVAHADVLVDGSALDALVDGPTGALVGDWFLGLVKVSAADRALGWEPGAVAADDDVPRSVLAGLVQVGASVVERPLRGYFWARPLSAAELERAALELAAHDEERARLDASVKATDGFFTTFFVSPYSKYIARWAARRGLTPNQVTTASLVVGIAAAAAFATGSRAGLVAGAVLLQAAFTADCVDGQLARYTRSFSSLGAWLDSIFDRTKEYAVYAGLAIGATRGGGDPVWLLAGAALALQTVRHAFDFSYLAVEEEDARGAPPRTFAAAVRGPDPPAAPAARALSAWSRLDAAPGLGWVKRMLVFPIGERFATVSITAALFTARTTFVVVLAWSGFAALYSLGGRLLRSLR
jgi:phosphatidylglycerophosphate synthase